MSATTAHPDIPSFNPNPYPLSVRLILPHAECPLPGAVPVRLKLEPWPPDYGTSAFDVAGNERLPDWRDINLYLELPAWRPLQPTPGRVPDFDKLYFSDGRRRSEQMVFAEGLVDGVYKSLPGLLGTVAVGLAESERSGSAACRISATRVLRVLILAGGHAMPDVQIKASDNQLGALHYRASSIEHADNRENALEMRLQSLMRQEEASLAASLSAFVGEQLLIIDGPLPLLPLAVPALGYIKTLHDLWIPPQEQRTLFALQAGQRTPLFLIDDRKPRWSWFLRLSTGEDWFQGLAGVVRLEYRADTGSTAATQNSQAEAVRVADWSCSALPRYAAASFRDPRAPQQLMPVAFLEAELGRRMGNLAIIRRRIRAHFQRAHQELEQKTPAMLEETP
jgi:uncharacterized protein